VLQSPLFSSPASSHPYPYSFPTRRSSDLLASCAQDSDNAQNAVASGSTFEFITPGGQQEIFYEEADRKPLQSFSGESLTDDSERSEEHTSELQSRFDLVCRLLLEKKKKRI